MIWRVKAVKASSDKACSVALRYGSRGWLRLGKVLYGLAMQGSHGESGWVLLRCVTLWLCSQGEFKRVGVCCVGMGRVSHGEVQFG